MMTVPVVYVSFSEVNEAWAAADKDESRAIADLWPRYGLDDTGTPRDLHAAFGNAAPVVLEIGFGNGE
ncbi:MAG TPA: hypothetical protein PLZ01_14850, partial [bacterium]|nr:hypothetical protein [bacterium]